MFIFMKLTRLYELHADLCIVTTISLTNQVSYDIQSSLLFLMATVFIPSHVDQNDCHHLHRDSYLLKVINHSPALSTFSPTSKPLFIYKSAAIQSSHSLIIMRYRDIVLQARILLLEMGSETFELDTSLYCSFLREFKESSYDELADGTYIIHYDDKHKDCEMKVKLENGKRDGETIILKSGKPWMKLNYRKGKLTGPIEKMDESDAV